MVHGPQAKDVFSYFLRVVQKYKEEYVTETIYIPESLKYLFVVSLWKKNADSCSSADLKQNKTIPKKSQQVGLDGSFLNLIKCIYKNLITNIISNG